MRPVIVILLNVPVESTIITDDIPPPVYCCVVVIVPVPVIVAVFTISYVHEKFIPSVDVNHSGSERFAV